jgi:hypothetical protein
MTTVDCTVVSRILFMHDFRYDLPLQPGLDGRGRARMIRFKGPISRRMYKATGYAS